MVFAGSLLTFTGSRIPAKQLSLPINPDGHLHIRPKINLPPLRAPVLKRRQSAAGCRYFSGKKCLKRKLQTQFAPEQDRKSIGQSCSAAVTSSLEDFTAVSGRHSLSEAMDFLSVQFLRLVGSLHGAYASF